MLKLTSMQSGGARDAADRAVDFFDPFQRPELERWGGSRTPQNGTVTDQNLEAAAHVDQFALTLVLFISATATLLNVFATRPARVPDRVDKLLQEAETSSGTVYWGFAAPLSNPG